MLTGKTGNFASGRGIFFIQSVFFVSFVMTVTFFNRSSIDVCKICHIIILNVVTHGQSVKNSDMVGESRGKVGGEFHL